MIGKRYQEKKKAALDIYRRYCASRGETTDGVDIEFLEARAKALEEGKYILAVVGEAKAGKSTLINALLGETVLPTDFLQSTSVIVEVFKSDKKYVEVQFADESFKTVADDLTTLERDEASEYLRQIGALQDRFRAIPTALLDTWIVQGRIQPNQPLPFAELQTESRMDCLGGNASSLIEEYVKGRTRASIPVKIKFGFPLKYAFDELCLVDSPGVNALGGLESCTLDYLCNANAVLFVHPLQAAVEQSSFHAFVTEQAPNRTREALFLVLSKAGDATDFEIEGKVAQARAQFSKVFDPQRVLHVDAMLQIISDDIRGFDSAAALAKHYKSKSTEFSKRQGQDTSCAEVRTARVAADNYSKKQRLLAAVLSDLDSATGHDAVLKALRHRSNFGELETAIEEFSKRAPDLQISEIIERVRIGYENQVKSIDQNTGSWKEKRKDPQAFAVEVCRIQKLIGEYQHDLNEFTDTVLSSYTGAQSGHRPQAQRLMASCEDTIKQAFSQEAVRKAMVDFNDEGSQLIDQVAANIRKEFANRLKLRGRELKEKHDIAPPTIDVDGIAEKAKQDAYHTVRTNVGSDRGEAAAAGGFLGSLFGGVVGFFVGGPVGAAIGASIGGSGGAGAGYASGDDQYKEDRVYSPMMHLANLQSGTIAAVQEVAEKTIPTILADFVNKYASSFRSAVGELVEERTRALDEIKEAESDNDTITERIGDEERKKKAIAAQVEQIDEMLEDLKG